MLPWVSEVPMMVMWVSPVPAARAAGTRETSMAADKSPANRVRTPLLLCFISIAPSVRSVFQALRPALPTL